MLLLLPQGAVSFFRVMLVHQCLATMSVSPTQHAFLASLMTVADTCLCSSEFLGQKFILVQEVLGHDMMFHTMVWLGHGFLDRFHAAAIVLSDPGMTDSEHVVIWGVPKMGVPQNLWFITGKTYFNG